MSKRLDFQASISDVKQVNPLFSTCRVRVLYTGKNRNMSIITKEAVEKALPTLKNIPIVGEFSEAAEDFKGHGGAVDLDSYKFIHTTKPYGVVPESATYTWEEVKGRDGLTREYLSIDGCYLWTGRYEEAYSVIEKGKGQSMEIEVIDGNWDDTQEAYQINNFTFSALCILGDDVEPAFEDASITAYSLDKDSFKREFSKMMSDLKASLSNDKEVDKMDLKKLLEKYSTSMEELTEKGINFEEISEDELEAKIVEVLETEKPDEDNSKDNQKGASSKEDNDGKDDQPENEDQKEPKNVEPKNEDQEENPQVKSLEDEIDNLKTELSDAKTELEELREFKLKVEKAEHESKVQKIFNDFQLTESDIKDLDIHKFSIEEIEEKCYAILGKKLANKKNFSKKSNSGSSIHLPLLNGEGKREDSPSHPYGKLFD
ncbi:hypothetical protein [Bacillus licheniformis]|uniref:hypothetical protein n=1 Tax=Bacillus licheniformis TaxID=1402 RepID=UPI000779D835|nr:hypothetical protein [Bacillus licheniformis]MDE1406979.1 hypothetical protein [Bacillus licheniformis]TWN76640.1 hypothetical protein CHCC20494_0703 [Bacillus licheniformis]